jgi:hypothetical protein
MQRDCQLIFEKYVNEVVVEALDMGTMTVEQLKDYLMTITRPTPVSVEVEAPAKMRKTGNPYVGAIKHSTINGMAGGDYEIGMQNREYAAHADNDEYQATLRAASLWNGKGIRISPLVIQHSEKGEYYLAIADPRSGSSYYTFNGEPIDKAQLEPFLQAPSVSQKQVAAGISAENTIQPRYPLLKNIKRIRINNVDLQIT